VFRARDADVEQFRGGDLALRACEVSYSGPTFLVILHEVEDDGREFAALELRSLTERGPVRGFRNGRRGTRPPPNQTPSKKLGGHGNDCGWARPEGLRTVLATLLEKRHWRMIRVRCGGDRRKPASAVSGSSRFFGAAVRALAQDFAEQQIFTEQIRSSYSPDRPATRFRHVRLPRILNFSDPLQAGRFFLFSFNKFTIVIFASLAAGIEPC
jgi:hypothetical protein